MPRHDSQDIIGRVIPFAYVTRVKEARSLREFTQIVDKAFYSEMEKIPGLMTSTQNAIKTLRELSGASEPVAKLEVQATRTVKHGNKRSGPALTC